MLIPEFESIRPFTDNEINAAMHRITSNPLFQSISSYLYPGATIDRVKDSFNSLNSVVDFQVNVMNRAVQLIVKHTSTGLTYSGIDQLDCQQRYLFVSNHRDIMLDSAILQIVLHINNHDTSEITFGDNLMSSDFIIDIGRSNKMFRLVRGGTPREILSNSMLTSRYIRHTITQKKQSVWIAQRNGRTKDGDDKTQLAVLKMFKMSGAKDFADNFMELNMAPLVISYEYDPCDIQKTREIYISRRQLYVKSEGEDMNSVLHGIRQPKGGIHIAFSAPLTPAELTDIGSLVPNDQFQALADCIDSRVYKNFYLWKTNLIAYDILHGETFGVRYSANDKDQFQQYMASKLSGIEGDSNELSEIFLGIYANPVVNFLKYNNPDVLPQDYIGVTSFVLEQ